MKTIHLLLFTICLALLTSCSNNNDLFGLEDSSSKSSNQTACEDSNGTISAQISGSDDFNNTCVFGTYDETQGWAQLSLANIESAQYNLNNGTLDQYLVIVSNHDLNSNLNCIQSVNGGGFLIYYFDQFRYGVTYENQDQEGFYSANESTDLEICLSTITSSRVTGTFSGTLYNYLGESKTISNGRFDFQF